MQKLLILFVCVYAVAAYRTIQGRYRADEQRPSPYSQSNSDSVLAQSIDKASMHILQATYQDAWDKNLVSSPLGLLTLLSAYNKGAGPVSHWELNRLLGTNNWDQNEEAFKELTVKLSEINPDSLTVADKISISNKYSLNPDFISFALDYHCEVNTLDFSRPNQAAANINRWAAEKTHGHITNPMQPDMLNPSTVAALYNVIYFKGHWNVPFNANETKPKIFHLNRNEAVNRPMMHLYETYAYYSESSELDAKLLQLPYREDGFRMVVVLPNQVDGLSSLINKAANQGLLPYISGLQTRYNQRSVDINMPKFEIRTSLNFKSILLKLGVSAIFVEPAPGIAREARVTISNILQEAVIEVDEEGSTAAASTVMLMDGITAYPKPISTFNADHPFLYAILYQDKILFAGTYAGK